MATELLTNNESGRYAIKPDSLAQSVVLLLSMTVIQRAVGFGRCIFLCRWLAPEELGHWDLTLGFLELAAPIAVLSIPACFVRYVEHYKQQDLLRNFLKRTSIAILFLMVCTVATLSLGQSWFSNFLYGGNEDARLVGLLVLVLPATIIFNAINELFSGLRMYRALSVMQFFQSILFAGFALSLAGSWHAGANSVIAAYGLTCALCSAVPIYWLTRMWKALPSNTTPNSQADFWRKILPFAGTVWLSNLLGNVFMMTDRYMIIHHSGMNPIEATMAVGQYHSARVVPLLIVQLSGIIGTMFVPFFTCDWEAGRRNVVCARLNMFLKLIGMGLTAVAVTILAASPILFVGIFEGKFSQGEAILSWTLLSAVWFSMFCIARSYLWCDERVWLVSLALGVGLGVNVGVNLVLLPLWGIQGAAVSASLANLALLLAIYLLATRRGMRISLGTWLISAVPAALCLGTWTAISVLAALAILSVTTTLVFNDEEKGQLSAFAWDYFNRLRALHASWRTSPCGTDAPVMTISAEEQI
jgi:polysaccharide transporter, PST family